MRLEPFPRNRDEEAFGLGCQLVIREYAGFREDLPALLAHELCFETKFDVERGRSAVVGDEPAGHPRVAAQGLDVAEHFVEGSGHEAAMHVAWGAFVGGAEGCGRGG